MASVSYIRTLFKIDIPLIERHFDELSTADIRSRFGGAPSKSFIKKYIKNLFEKNTKVFGVFNNNSTILMGLVELHLSAKSAELGISVDGKFRGQGLGNKLFDYALDYCVFSGIEKLYIIANRDNLWIKHKINKLNMKNIPNYDQLEAEYTIPALSWVYLVEKLNNKLFNITNNYLKKFS